MPGKEVLRVGRLEGGEMKVGGPVAREDALHQSVAEVAITIEKEKKRGFSHAAWMVSTGGPEGNPSAAEAQPFASPLSG